MILGKKLVEKTSVNEQGDFVTENVWDSEDVVTAPNWSPSRARPVESTLRTTLKVDGKPVKLGSHATEEEAARVYDKYILEHNLRDALRSERDAACSDRDTLRSERDAACSDRDTLRSERDVLQIQLTCMTSFKDQLLAKLAPA
ncbi:hypothetical protein JL722_9738 [Aureococcus anophagefferens]|nr:hypothetical protein JL722_9738 [Aureococcus anophagefferens]